MNLNEALLFSLKLVLSKIPLTDKKYLIGRFIPKVNKKNFHFNVLVVENDNNNDTNNNSSNHNNNVSGSNSSHNNSEVIKSEGEFFLLQHFTLNKSD